MRLIFLILLLFLPHAAFAEAKIINVDGLSFECAQCKKTDGNFCEVPWQGKAFTVLCDSLFEILLQHAYEEKKQDYPKSEELLSLIAHSDSQINLAFKILINRKLEAAFLTSLLDLMLSRHYQLILDAIENNLLNYEQNLELWQFKHRLRPREVYLLAKNIPEKGFDEFLKELSVVDVASDILFLESVSSVSTASEKEELSLLLSFIKSCSENYQCELRSENLEVSRYANRLQNSIVSKAILEGKLKSVDGIKLLAKIHYIDHRTPETHEALLAAIEEIVANRDFSKFWDKLEIEEKDFISFMASHDSRIANLIYHKKSNSFLIWLLAAIFCIATVFYYFKRNTLKVVKENSALRSDIEELSQIWSFFDLESNANLADLKKRYREMARELHPDSGNQDAEEFLKLNTFYQRAVKLLSSGMTQ